MMVGIIADKFEVNSAPFYFLRRMPYHQTSDVLCTQRSGSGLAGNHYHGCTIDIHPLPQWHR